MFDMILHLKFIYDQKITTMIVQTIHLIVLSPSM
jgi:hypothetical protein